MTLQAPARIIIHTVIQHIKKTYNLYMKNYIHNFKRLQFCNLVKKIV